MSVPLNENARLCLIIYRFEFDQLVIACALSMDFFLFFF